MIPSTYLERLSKVWIPGSLQSSGEPKIKSFINGRHLSSDHTLRFSQIKKGTGRIDELFIPEYMVLDAKDFHIYAQCFKTVQEVKNRMKELGVPEGTTVDYTSSVYAGKKPAGYYQT